MAKVCAFVLLPNVHTKPNDINNGNNALNQINQINIMKKLITMIMLAVAIGIGVLSGCKEQSIGNEQERFNDIVFTFSNEIQSAPNELSYDDITFKFQDSIKKFLWCNAPFVNWEGTLIDIETEKEYLMGREALMVSCLISTKISKDIEGSFLLTFYKNDKPSVFNNLQDLSLRSNVYFSFEPWQIQTGVQLHKDIISKRFNLLGGISYIGRKPQSYSEDARKIVEYYDSVRAINHSAYIRVMDSLPSEFTRLSEEEQLLIQDFSSFRNIYDEEYPRHSQHKPSQTASSTDKTKE